MSGLLEKPPHLLCYIFLGTFIGQSLQIHLIDCFNQSSRCWIFMGVSYSGPVISSGDAQKEADGFNLKSKGKNFLVVLPLPLLNPTLPSLWLEDASTELGEKCSLMTNVRRVSVISLQILTRLPSGSRVLTPTPTPPLRRENRILWLVLQTLLPMSQGSHLCVILWMQTMGWDGLSVLHLKQYTAIVSSLQKVLLQCTTPQYPYPSLNREGSVQLFLTIRSLKSFLICTIEF